MARRHGPWAAWATAVAVAAGLQLSHAGLGSAPAAAEAREVLLGAPAAARVQAIFVLPGERVSADQLLARLTSAETEARVALAQAELKAAEAKVTARRTELAVRFQDRRTMDAARVAAAVAQLDAEEKRDRAQLREMDDQIARESLLVKSGAASSTTLDKLKLGRAALSQAVESYPTTLKRAREHLDTAQESADTVKRAEAWLAPEYAEVTRATAALTLAQARQQQLEIRAPVGGRIGAVLLAPGATAREGALVLTIVDERPSIVVAWIDQSWANDVQVGDSVSLTPIDRSGTAHTGHVVTVGPGIVETPKRFQPVAGKSAWSREARIQIDPGTSPLVPGQAFRADFRRGAPPVDSKVTTAQ
jgi:HlyD family secretion protein